VVRCGRDRQNSVADASWRHRHPDHGQLPADAAVASVTAPRRLFDPLTRTASGSGPGRHKHSWPKAVDPTVQPLPSDRFKADLQPIVRARQLPDRPRSILHGSRSRRESGTSPAGAFGDRHRMLNLGNIKRTKSCYTSMVRPPRMRPPLVPPSNPPLLIARKTGPPASATGHNV